MSRTPTEPPHVARPRRAVVLLGGPDAVADRRWTLPAVVADLFEDGERPLVVAADAGLHRAVGAGLRVDVVVGDLDSVDPGLLAATAATGVRVERAPEAKDRTDLALALDEACDRGAEEIVVVGGTDGRLDHLLAAALVLGSPRYAGAVLTAVIDRARLEVVRPGRATVLTGALGDLVSLLAIGGPARGVSTTGLHYPLDGESLEAGGTRGISNELAATTATVTVGEGTLLVVQPGEAGTHHARGLGPGATFPRPPTPDEGATT